MGGSKTIQRSILTVIILFLLLSTFAGLLTDYWWFDALDFTDIFLISLKAKVALFVLAGLLFFCFALLNVWLCDHFGTKKKAISFRAKALAIGAFSLFVGFTASSSWFTVLQWMHQVSFGLADPILGKDVSFYVFSLPFLLSLWNYLMLTIILTLLFVLADYFSLFIIQFFQKPKQLNPDEPIKNVETFTLKDIFKGLKRRAIVHLGSLGALAFLLLGVRHYLAQYAIMYSEQGIVVGAGYADVTAYLPIMKILMIIAILIALLFIIWIFYLSKEPKLKKKHILAYAIIVYVLFGFVGPTLVPMLVQTFVVNPNEINLEQPYIANNIKFTNIAYGLDNVEEHTFPVEQGITADRLQQASATIDNVRLLDWRPLTQTYKQTQEIRLYYDLSGIDIDRYMIDGRYTQVMIAPRELDQRQLADNAKTWQNLHMIYTHGYGVVMSPVNRVTEEGLPHYFMKDIPPVTSVNESSLYINQPRIYYGEKENQFVLVNTNQPEFDYPQGNENQVTHYDGKGGIVLDSFFKKLLMAFRFKDINILLTREITPESKIMFKRNIQERINTITPFLALDKDPYIVLHNGKLVWIQDAYTLAKNFPYSAKYQGINYIRNAVKIVVDAYDGSVTYYVSDTEDPLIQTYMNIFPGQFKQLSAMPEGLQQHIRYPEDLFTIQTQIYSTYHMKDPTVFYNKEDAWQIPSEIYGVSQQIKMDPYYIIMQLPGEEQEELVMMISFTPIKKDNMNAWFAARSDREHYGKLLLYRFPKDTLIYGPSQIEAQFDQDSDISQQLTLWSQRGSQVTRGNLLVIPIDNSLLYIEPLYLQAEKGQLPQLKRVLVSDGKKVVMEETLAEALQALFGRARIPSQKEETTSVIHAPLETDLLSQANQYYEAVLTAMEQQDWQGMGTNFEKLGNVLTDMKE